MVVFLKPSKMEQYSTVLFFYVSLMVVFLKASKMEKYSTVPKAFS